MNPGQAPSPSPQEGNESAQSFFDLHKQRDERYEELSRITGRSNREEYIKDQIEPLEEKIKNHTQTKVIQWAHKKNYDEGMSFSRDQQFFTNDFDKLYEELPFNYASREMGLMGTDRGFTVANDRTKVIQMRKFFEEEFDEFVSSSNVGEDLKNKALDLKKEFHRLFPMKSTQNTEI
jgi:hypothetical protein